MIRWGGVNRLFHVELSTYRPRGDHFVAAEWPRNYPGLVADYDCLDSPVRLSTKFFERLNLAR